MLQIIKIAVRKLLQNDKTENFNLFPTQIKQSYIKKVIFKQKIIYMLKENIKINKKCIKLKAYKNC